MLSENKFSKYLIYAIGEIFLVMIGILLAFQVNTWSEIKKEKKLEIDLLSEVRQGLKEDLIQLMNTRKLQELINTSQNTFIEWLDDQNSIDHNISKEISRTLFISEFLPNKGPYETMKQFGMKKIQNDSLRSQITFVYEVVYNQYNDYLRMYRNQLDKLGPYFENHLNEINYFDASVMKINDIQEMKADKRLRFNIATLQNIGETLPLHLTPKTLSSIEITLHMLNEELGK